MTQSPQNLLFVGNSLSKFNGNIHTHVMGFVECGQPTIGCRADGFYVYGQTLKKLWLKHDAEKTIREGDHDCVILQDDIPETDVATFYEYARKYVELVRAKRATPLLFMAWDYPRLGWLKMDRLAEAYATIARELKVRVAPVGLAWKAAMACRPEVDLFMQDKEHPNMAGTYLSAAVLYSVLFNKDPSSLTYCPEELDEPLCVFLRKTAWESVCAYPNE